MTLDPHHAQTAWEDAGHAVAARLDHRFAVVLFGDDIDATTWVALGIARGHTVRRRVAIADLTCGAPTLTAMVRDTDPHGVVECCTYGLSLSAVARDVAGQVNLFVLPTGGDGTVSDDVFRDEKWRKLASNFKEIGALLLIVARGDATGVKGLSRLLDGAIAVGDTSGTSGSWANLVAAVDLPGEASRRASRLDVPQVIEGAEDGSAIPQLRTPPHTRAAQRMVSAGRRRQQLMVGTLLLMVVAAGAAGVYWKRAGIMARLQALTDKAGSGRGSARDPRRVSSGAQIAPPIQPAPTTVPAVVEVASMAANPADSARASAWAVEVVAVNTKTGAQLKLQELAPQYASVTYGAVIVPPNGLRRFSVVIGASNTTDGAQATLAALRRSGVVPADGGRVVRRPFALLVKEDVASDEALLEITGYQALGYPMYGLAKGDGRVRIYAGAFETADQARQLASALQMAGVSSTVVYRLGRSL
jgi:hypothetical protein